MSGVRTHEWIDQRSLAMARAIARKLRDDPRLLEVARTNLARWKRTLRPWPEALSEWETILAQDIETILEHLVEDSPQGRRLRQSHPFPGVLTPQERQAILEEYESLST